MTSNCESHQADISMTASAVAIDFSGVNHCGSVGKYMSVYNQNKQATGKPLSIYQALSRGACCWRYWA